MTRIILKLKYLIPLIIFILLSVLIAWFYAHVIYDSPLIDEKSLTTEERVVVEENYFRLGPNWLRKSKGGNWESYIEGNAQERGQIIGKLHRELIIQQEEAFVGELKKQIPNAFYRRLLTLGIAWFNRDLDQHIPQEYREEIAGIARFFSDDYDYIGPKYNRLINYHAAHDIGHAVQNMRLVGCTAVGQWSKNDSSFMILGRNFDFYVGDEFAKNKLVMLINPDEGYKFLSVGWGGFCGVVSGMNEKGLGITLNSLKSEIPEQAGTPVSIIARDILQYAASIDEAISIAAKYTSFVSESFTISSAADGRMAIIEKTPNQMDVYWPSDTTLIATNHCQSPKLNAETINLEHMSSSESTDRYERTKQLLSRRELSGVEDMASILRDQKALNDRNIGTSNPELINQLIAHHSVIFKNYEKQVWVSNYPYQINGYDAYDLDDFNRWASPNHSGSASIDSLTITPDAFFSSPDYKTFEKFKQLKSQLAEATKKELMIDDVTLQTFTASNPEYYETYRLLGNYYVATGQTEAALLAYQKSLTKKIAYQEDSIFIVGQVQQLAP